MKKLPLWKTAGFTLVELLTVMLIILLLAGLILGTVGFAQKKAARARAESEIYALSAAIENYKVDNGTYPRCNTDAPATVPPDTSDAETDKVNAKTNGNPTNYKAASLALYLSLSGDLAKNGKLSAGRTNYMSKGFKDDIYGRSQPSTPVKAGNEVAYLSDPFGSSYGYSTANSHYFAKNPNAAPADAPGYNPSFDLWSTGGATATTAPAATDTVAIAKMQAGWVKNW